MKNLNKILVTGGTGMLGKALSNHLSGNFIGSSECDLRNKVQTDNLIKDLSPSVVVHLAARVGGMVDNIKYPYEYLYDNVMINTNIINSCVKNGVNRFIASSSTCAYPGVVDVYPMVESDLFSGPPELLHMGYSCSKRIMQVQLDAAEKQYGFKSCVVYLSNLYGPFDYFGERSHLVASLLSKIHKTSRCGIVKMLGTGKPLRQFTYIDDAARMVCQIIDSDVVGKWNISTDENLSVKQITDTVANAVGFEGDFLFSGKMDGQFRKDVSIDKFVNCFGECKFVSLKDGARKTNEWYKMEIND